MFMQQSLQLRLAPPPRATEGHFPALSVPKGGALENFAQPGDRAFANSPANSDQNDTFHRQNWAPL